MVSRTHGQTAAGRGIGHSHDRAVDQRISRILKGPGIMETQTVDHLEIERQRLVKKRQSLVEEFTKIAAKSGKQKRLSTLFIKIRQTNDFLESLDLIQADVEAKQQGTGRSEERRVGKECRSRWSPYH